MYVLYHKTVTGILYSEQLPWKHVHLCRTCTHMCTAHEMPRACVWLCVYVCVCACVHACMCACECVCMHACVRAYVRACVYTSVFVYVCVHACMYLRLCLPHYMTPISLHSSQVIVY